MSIVFANLKIRLNLKKTLINIRVMSFLKLQLIKSPVDNIEGNAANASECNVEIIPLDYLIMRKVLKLLTFFVL